MNHAGACGEYKKSTLFGFEGADKKECDDTARWSSGQDGGLSRRKREFDSPTGHHLLSLERESKQREL